MFYSGITANDNQRSHLQGVWFIVKTNCGGELIANGKLTKPIYDEVATLVNYRDIIVVLMLKSTPQKEEKSNEKQCHI